MTAGAPEWFGTVPQWIAAFSSTGILALAAKFVPDLIRSLNERRKMNLEDGKQRRAEKKHDLDDCHQRLDQMSTRLERLVETVNNLKVEMSGILAAYRVLEAAEERRDPTSLQLMQARAILSAAFTVAPSSETRSPESRHE